MEKRDKQIEVVVAGHICLDITPDLSGISTDLSAVNPVESTEATENTQKSSESIISEIFTPGKLTNVKKANISLGGAVSNTGLALSVLGVESSIMAKVGDDSFGENINGILESFGAKGAINVVAGEETSYSIVIVPPGVDRMFLHNPGANNTFSADDIDYDLVKNSRLFHFGYPPAMKLMYENNGIELAKIFSQIKSLGVTTSLDMCLPDPDSPSGKIDWTALLSNVLPFVDLFVPSFEELVFMLDKAEYYRLKALSSAIGKDIISVMDMNYLPHLGDRLLKLGVKIVVIKCGNKGYYIKTANAEKLQALGKDAPYNVENWSDRELIEEVYNIPKVVSATGAGDTSIAGFLAALLRGYSVEDALKTACGVGSLCVQTCDALSGIKSLNHVIHDIRSGWQKDRIEIEGKYWKYDEICHVWRGNE